MSAFITTGKLNDGQEFSVRSLNLHDIDEVMSLQKKVVLALAEPDFLQPLTVEEYTKILNNNDLMIGVFVGEKMIAFRAMLAPENDDEGLGADIGLRVEEFSSIIYSEISNVDPDFRGNGLQTYMGKILLRNLDRKKYKYMLATVAPFNIASLKDKFALGMEIAELKEKFGGKLRYLFVKELTKESTSSSTSPTEYINMSDMKQQKMLLNEGYRGIAMEKRGNEWFIRFESRNRI
ncbi:GNAT family N-acetyltransferase [Oceanobacillus saliphilus]|uniref:GNAT family N-acetyltransferase n=1 Tax=Oceanobacillus saliphilus TaxID=2925834 RepID=UPI00201DB768|nr:hypothetical protein [Oceanobacillus saliphilus]